jgi:hypothetical protein
MTSEANFGQAPCSSIYSFPLHKGVILYLHLISSKDRIKTFKVSYNFHKENKWNFSSRLRRKLYFIFPECWGPYYNE